MAEVLLEVSDLVSGYGRVQVLRGVNLVVHAGETVAVLGSNGAGKTTLNNTLSALVRAWSGRIRFAGEDISACHHQRVVRAGLIQVPEGRKIFPNLNVLENLELGAYARAGSRIASNIDKVFGIFPRLAERRSQAAGTMSGGEQQMLAIGRGLMAEPRLMVLDEPSLGLSPLLVEEMFALIRQLKEDGLSIMLVEQNVGQALEIAERAYVMENGVIEHSGLAADLLHSDAIRKAYLGL